MDVGVAEVLEMVSTGLIFPTPLLLGRPDTRLGSTWSIRFAPLFPSCLIPTVSEVPHILPLPGAVSPTGYEFPGEELHAVSVMGLPGFVLVRVHRRLSRREE